MKPPIQRFTIHGDSMVPTLHEGQDIISFNWAYIVSKPKRGDVVVIKQNGKEVVKRVQKVLGREVFVTGDNKKASTDSRHFGPVKMDQIIGKVVYTSNEVACLNCESTMLGIAGRKDAICQNCGFRLTCCGEP